MAGFTQLGGVYAGVISFHFASRLFHVVSARTVDREEFNAVIIERYAKPR